MVNRIGDERNGLGCGCVDVGSENRAAICKFLFQSSTTKRPDGQDEKTKRFKALSGGGSRVWVECTNMTLVGEGKRERTGAIILGVAS